MRSRVKPRTVLLIALIAGSVISKDDRERLDIPPD